MKKLLLSILAVGALAFTACEKDDMGVDTSSINVLVKKQKGEVSFGSENGIINDEASVTGKEVTVSHIYSNANNDVQTLNIYASGDEGGTSLYSGTYTPGDISTLVDVSGSRVLDYGDYVAVSSGNGDASGSLIDFLAYTSRAAFTLDAETKSVTLDVTLLKGAIFVGLQNGGVTAASGSISGGAAQSLFLTADEHFYGYISAGAWSISGTSANGDDTASFNVEAGKHYIFYPSLIDGTDQVSFSAWTTVSDITEDLPADTAWSPATAESGVASITQTRTVYTGTGTRTLTEERTASVAVDGDVDVPAATITGEDGNEYGHGEKEERVTITPASIVATVETQVIANPDYQPSGEVIFNEEEEETNSGTDSPTGENVDTATDPVITTGFDTVYGTFSESNVGDKNSDGDILDSGDKTETFIVTFTDGVETSRVSSGIAYTVTDDQTDTPVDEWTLSNGVYSNQAVAGITFTITSQTGLGGSSEYLYTIADTTGSTFDGGFGAESLNGVTGAYASEADAVAAAIALINSRS